MVQENCMIKLGLEKHQMTSVGEDVEELESCAASGNVQCAATLGKSDSFQ